MQPWSGSCGEAVTTIPRAVGDALLGAVRKFTIVSAFGGNGVPDAEEWRRLGVAVEEYERAVQSIFDEGKTE